ncbi:methionine biosynthesis protein MetW [Algiphilus sp.]|uniref:methionine biosynthesis protein MetW n=1 Tax=Algiphilus sp. TaxID=1872431 RepID=UPI0025BF069E|nr:methionine biosynthesis protein MetW [Algiphilus sp.]
MLTMGPRVPEKLRPDLALISDWIPSNAHILDLGCGEGALLAYLNAERGVTGYGLEIDEDEIAAAIGGGVNVIQGDVDDGLQQYAAGSFDFVVMTQALQALQRPDLAIGEMLRVGRTAIVTFPNFGHWMARLDVLRGRMPLTRTMPEHWYDSENIHLCTVRDFEVLCEENDWRITRRNLLNHDHQDGWLQRFAPNLFTEIAVYMLESRKEAA